MNLRSGRGEERGFAIGLGGGCEFSLFELFAFAPPHPLLALLVAFLLAEQFVQFLEILDFRDGWRFLLQGRSLGPH